MKILLIDADSLIPNIVLMKLSYYHKNKGDEVSFKKLNLKYPWFKNSKFYKINTKKYDKIYCSVVFQNSINYIKKDNIEFGGTGFDLNKKLPDEIEKNECDYSLYPDNRISYGFITRGCIRNCKFCVVPKKEGIIRQVSNIDDIVRHSEVKFLDNNILAYEKHNDILLELVEKRINCQFNQGLDIRLIDKKNSLLLSKLNYMDETGFLFAFDDIKLQLLIEKKLQLMEWRKPWQFKFFVYIHPDMTVKNIMDRILFLKENKCLPYLMRDIKCFFSYKNKFYIKLIGWANVPFVFKYINFEEYLYNYRKKTINSLGMINEYCNEKN